ncbi:MAG: hypothetical protein LBD11_01870 [Candidatus Peribacteria bacterium]|jgi:hypothetical protein|nr:hypothetical protein [Candidatus Peribacteria bacterium]
MATSTSSRNAQDHYANLKDKIKFLPDDLKEIVSANLATSLQTGFSALSPTEMKEMKKDLSALIADPNVSEPEKEKFRLLETEIAVRYPPKIELTGEMSTKLVSRDNLAKAISENRRSKEDGIPSGTITFSTIFPAEKLENYPLYTEMEAKYKEAVEHKDDKKLEELDTQFAEKIILFKDFYIQINNEKLEPGATDYKSGDELRKEAIQ